MTWRVEGYRNPYVIYVKNGVLNPLCIIYFQMDESFDMSLANIVSALISVPSEIAILPPMITSHLIKGHLFVNMLLIYVLYYEDMFFNYHTLQKAFSLYFLRAVNVSFIQPKHTVFCIKITAL